MSDAAELAIQRRARTTDGLDLFQQRLASPEAQPAPTPRARVTMPGPSTHARAEAKVKADRTLTGRRGKILLALRAHGPMTRLALMQATGLAENSVNSAVNALLVSKHVHLLSGLDPATGRSIVALTEEG